VPTLLKVISAAAAALVPVIGSTIVAVVREGLGTLGGLGRWQEAIAAYDEVERRFGDAQEPALREQVARALVNKGVRLGQPGL
jgi:hypothetical protein